MVTDEQVERACIAASNVELDAFSCSWEETPEKDKRQARRLVRAMLEAYESERFVVEYVERNAEGEPVLHRVPLIEWPAWADPLTRILRS